MYTCISKQGHVRVHVRVYDLLSKLTQIKTGSSKSSNQGRALSYLRIRVTHVSAGRATSRSHDVTCARLLSDVEPVTPSYKITTIKILQPSTEWSTFLRNSAAHISNSNSSSSSSSHQQTLARHLIASTQLAAAAAAREEPGLNEHYTEWRRVRGGSSGVRRRQR